MYKRLNELSFVIGLFFVFVAVILFINGFVSTAAKSNLTFYSAGSFLIFGSLMLLSRPSGDKKG